MGPRITHCERYNKSQQSSTQITTGMNSWNTGITRTHCGHHNNSQHSKAQTTARTNSWSTGITRTHCRHHKSPLPASHQLTAGIKATHCIYLGNLLQALRAGPGASSGAQAAPVLLCMPPAHKQHQRRPGKCPQTSALPQQLWSEGDQQGQARPVLPLH